MALLASRLGGAFALLDAVDVAFLLGGVAFVVVAAFDGVLTAAPNEPFRTDSCTSVRWLDERLFARDPSRCSAASSRSRKLFDFSAAEPPVESAVDILVAFSNSPILLCHLLNG